MSDLAGFLSERIAEDELVIEHGDGGLLMDDAYFSELPYADHPDYRQEWKP